MKLFYGKSSIAEAQRIQLDNHDDAFAVESINVFPSPN
jgi:hypothetical protein